MKQLASLLLLWFLLLVWYNSYLIYLDKDYKSRYKNSIRNSGIVIEELFLDKEKIQRLSKNIKGLKKDPVFRLKLNNFSTTEKQPLFKEHYWTLYEKIVKQNQKNNKPNR